MAIFFGGKRICVTTRLLTTTYNFSFFSLPPPFPLPFAIVHPFQPPCSLMILIWIFNGSMIRGVFSWMFLFWIFSENHFFLLLHFHMIKLIVWNSITVAIWYQPYSYTDRKNHPTKYFSNFLPWIGCLLHYSNAFHWMKANSEGPW